MVDEHAAQAEPMLQHEDALNRIPSAEFVAVWRSLVGEPPAMMLESRSEMIRLLVDSIPIAGPVGTAEAENNPNRRA